MSLVRFFGLGVGGALGHRLLRLLPSGFTTHALGLEGPHERKVLGEGRDL